MNQAFFSTNKNPNFLRTSNKIWLGGTTQRMVGHSNDKNEYCINNLFFLVIEDYNKTSVFSITTQ